MNVNEIEDVLTLSNILSIHGCTDAERQRHLIAALLDWKKGTPVAPVRDTVQETVAKVNEIETEAEPEPPAPAKKAPAKAAAKGRAKPPAPAASDDDADF